MQCFLVVTSKLIRLKMKSVFLLLLLHVLIFTAILIAFDPKHLDNIHCFLVDLMACMLLQCLNLLKKIKKSFRRLDIARYNKSADECISR